MGAARLIAPLLLAAAGAAILVVVIEHAGGDFSGWPQWQAIAVPAAAFGVPALLSSVALRANGAVEAISWGIACAAVQFALVVGVAFALLGYGPG